jgi:hypothetical protein
MGPLRQQCWRYSNCKHFHVPSNLPTSLPRNRKGGERDVLNLVTSLPLTLPRNAEPLFKCIYGTSRYLLHNDFCWNLDNERFFYTLKTEADISSEIPRHTPEYRRTVDSLLLGYNASSMSNYIQTFEGPKRPRRISVTGGCVNVKGQYCEGTQASTASFHILSNSRFSSNANIDANDIVLEINNK